MTDRRSLVWLDQEGAGVGVSSSSIARSIVPFISDTMAARHADRRSTPGKPSWSTLSRLS